MSEPPDPLMDAEWIVNHVAGHFIATVVTSIHVGSATGLSSPYREQTQLNVRLLEDGAIVYSAFAVREQSEERAWFLSDGGTSEERAGAFPPAVASHESSGEVLGITASVSVKAYNLTIQAWLHRFAHGRNELANLWPHGPDPEHCRRNAWDCLRLYEFGFFNPRKNVGSIVPYMEIHSVFDPLEWSPRLGNSRAYENLLLAHFDRKNQLPNSSLSALMQLPHGNARPRVEQGFRGLAALRKANAELKMLVAQDAPEPEIHSHIEENPLLLEPRAVEVASKPQFRYPEGEFSPNGKSYVEPDFVITLPGPRYVVVEIERAGKHLYRRSGQQRAELSQAQFQLREFEQYIRSHGARLLAAEFPGIWNTGSCEYLLVVGSGDLVPYGQVADTLITWDHLTSSNDLLIAELLTPADNRSE
ncbi:MAG: hypothetical protein HKN91_09285 [Acidimicrobiia bacterium]|nr:hypothetical protein [Acidimicrobiia bacterium]